MGQGDPGRQHQGGVIFLDSVTWSGRRFSPRAIIMEHSDGLFDTDEPEYSVVILYRRLGGHRSPTFGPAGPARRIIPGKRE
jgi:hypothetical protein